jgi:DNA-binding winged helix-turn-helix (wHTH) protein
MNPQENPNAPILEVSGCAVRSDRRHAGNRAVSAREPAEDERQNRTFVMARTSTDGGVFAFGRFRVLVRERVLLKGDEPVNLGGRAFDVLVALVERAGETVSRKALFELVWPDVIVAKVNLRVHVAALRKALGDGEGGQRLIVCVAGRGYRFVAPVSRFRSHAVCVVDFAGIDDPAQIATAVASALGCEEESQRPLISVLDYLRDKEMLVVFHNCEHVFANIAQLMTLLFTEAPRLHVLVSRRGAHRLSGVVNCG